MLIEQIKYAVVGREGDVLRDVCNIPADIVREAEEFGKNRHEYPCPRCGGKTRFRILDLLRGALFCSHCCKTGEQGSGDIIGAVRWAKDCDSKDACRILADYLCLNLSPKRANTIEATSIPKGSISNSKTSISKDTFFQAYYWLYDFDNAPIGVVRRTEKEGESKDVIRGRWDGKIVWKNAPLAPYVAGAQTSDGTPPQCAPWSSVFEADCLYIAEGEKKSEALARFVKPVLTMGASSLASKWECFAPKLYERNPRARIIIFGDNDEPGEKAVDNTAAAFWKAGFRSIVKVYMRYDRSGAPARATYDIDDWLSEGTEFQNDFDTLIDPDQNENAIFYDPLKEENLKRRLEAARIQRERREELENEKVQRDLAGNSEPFPFDALEAEFERAARAWTLKFKGNEGAIVAKMFSAFGGFISPNGAELIYGSEVSPNIHSVNVGTSGAGKSPIAKRVFKRIKEIEKKANKNAGNRESWTRESEYLQKQWDNLRKRLDKAKHDGEDTKRIEQDLEAVGKELDAARRLARSNGKLSFSTLYRSAQGVIKYLNRREKIARALGVNNGAHLLSDESCGMFNAAHGAKSLSTEWGWLNIVADGGRCNAETVNDEGADPDDMAITFALDVQPESCSFVKHKELRGVGFANRFLWSRVRRARVKTDRGNEYLEEIEPFYRLFDAAYKAPKMTFELDDKAAEEYERILEKYVVLANEASDNGRKELEAFYSKLETILLQIALDSKCAAILGGREELENPRGKIAVRYIRNADRLVSWYVKERDATWRLMKNEVSNDDDLAFDISDDSIKVLEKIKKDGDLVDLTKDDLDAGIIEARLLSVDDLRTLSAYKDKSKRKLIDQELLARGSICYQEDKSAPAQKPKICAIIIGGDNGTVQTEVLPENKKAEGVADMHECGTDGDDLLVG